MVEYLLTESEYLFWIPPADHQRAKRNSGGRWDAARGCWVFPRTRQVRDQLQAEFGKEARRRDQALSAAKSHDHAKHQPNSVVQGQKSTTEQAAAQSASLQEENQNLRSELSKIHKTLELISAGATNGSRSEVQALEAAIAARQNELSEVRIRLQERERALEALRKTSAVVQAEVERLRDENAALQEEASKCQGTSQPAESFERLVKEVAKGATGGDLRFKVLIDRVRLNESLPNELAKQLERELRRVLGTDDRNLSLRDLLAMANDAKLLTERGIDLAHTIRRHRNILTHENTDARTHIARVLLCMFAAALLWPEFSE